MKLYYTSNSPYARITRIAARQSGLIDQIEEIEVVTRVKETEYFKVTPLARVPVFTNGNVVVADTRDICSYFDSLTEKAIWLPEETHEERYLRHVICGFLDGIAVWLRENYRAEDQKSEPVMLYEEHRACNVLKWLEARWNPADCNGYTELALACAVDIALDRGMGKEWKHIAPDVLTWTANKAKEASMQQTKPQPM